MKTILQLSVIAAILALMSCSGNHKKKDTTEDTGPKPGEITDPIACKKDRNITYSLFLPAAYNTEKSWPLVIAFDAHGKGIKPVQLLQKSAGEYGYIVAGSNNSRNGVDWNTTSAQYDILLADLFERFNIDKNRIYTCGFSGGARVASSVALFRGGISGVIACSAGFPQLKDPIKHKFDFFGIAGNADMNYAEMAGLDKALEKSGFRHQLLIFDGSHEWPPDSILAEAMLWCELNAMKDRKKPINNELINKEFHRFIQEYSRIGNKSRFSQYLLGLRVFSYFGGLCPEADSIQAEVGLLGKTAAIRSNLVAEEALLKKELILQQQYAKELNVRDAAWWRSEMQRLNTFVARSQNQSEVIMVKRVIEYLSLAAFSTTQAYLKQQQNREAEDFAVIYGIIDPDNPEPEFIIARLMAVRNDRVAALKHLEKAADLGFSESSRIQNDTVFFKLNGEKSFGTIVDKVKLNAAKGG